MANKGHKSPSRIRYDEKNPVISVRVSRELKAQLDEIRETSGKSLGDILREVVGVQGK